MTTATWQSTSESALTLPWVRTFCAWLAANTVSEQPAKPATAEERRIRADVAASLRGDGAAYARIIERFQSTIARRMTRFTRDPNAIEELTHDVFVEAYFSLPSYQARCPARTLVPTNRNACWLSVLEAKRTSAKLHRTTKRFTIDRVARERLSAADDDREEVAQVLEQLPPRDRLVLTLFYIESRSVAEAADLAGWSQTMVKVQAYRARQKFQKLYRKMNAPASGELNYGRN